MSKNVNEEAKLWLKNEIRPYRISVIFLTCFSVITTILSLAFAYVTRYLINSASAKDESLLWIFSGVILGLLLLRIALQTVSGYYAEKLRAKITAELRTRMFSKILRSDYAGVQKYHSGELLNRLTTDIAEIATDTVGLTPTIVGMVVQCLGAIVALLTINPLFTAIYVVCGGIFCGITALFRHYIKKYQKAVLQADGAHRAYMQEGLSSVMTVKAYGAEDKSTEKARFFAGNYFKARMKRNALRSSMSAVFSLLSNFGLIFAVVWCSISVLFGNTDYGSILSVILLLMQLQQPLTGFSSVIPVYYSRIASAERLQELESLPCETLSENSVDVHTVYENTSHIAFENVSFDYGRELVIQNANLNIEKGEIVCLTGPSGAGKSTVFKLLLNVYAPVDGRMLLCGKDTLALTAIYRGLFAYVPQGNFLFSGSIYENLTFFSDEKDESKLQEKIRSALQVACAEFVWELPQGLQTPLMEGGAGLSEGQMQRLAVARAIISDRPILLLDEATSALDGKTETQLLQNIKNLKNKTCIIVTHRPAALEIADRVLRVENGTVTIA